MKYKANPELFLVLVSCILSAFYLIKRSHIAVCLLAFLPIMYIVGKIVSDARITIRVTASRALPLVFFGVLLAGIYGYFIFTFGVRHHTGFFDFISAFAQKGFVSIATTVVLYFSAFSLGGLVSRKYSLISTAIGFIGLSSFYLVLGFFGTFYPIPATIVTLIAPMVFLCKLLTKGAKEMQVLKGVRDFSKIQIVVSPAGFGKYIASAVFICGTIAFSIKGFIEGPDGLRQYLVVTQFIADNGRIPNINSYGGGPFPFEVLASFPFLLGGITAAKFFLNSFLFLIVYEVFLISKRVGAKRPWIPVFIVITSPMIMYLITVEYKVELFLIFFLFAGFLALLEKSKITMFLFCFSYLIKITAIFMALPLLAYYVALNLTQRKVKNLLIGLALAVLPIAVWGSSWRIPLPFMGDFSLRKITPENRVEVLTSCQEDALKYEQNTYYGGETSLLHTTFIKPFFPTSNGLSSLTDYGLFYVLLLFLFCGILIRELALFRILNIKDAIVPLLVFISFIPWFVLRRDGLWYNCAPFLLLLIYFFVFLEKHVSQNTFPVLEKIFVFMLIQYCCFYVFIDPYITYIPPNIGEKELYQEKRLVNRVAFKNIYEGGKIVRIDDSKIIFSSSLPFVRINYFFKNSLERIIYFDYVSESTKTPHGFKSFLSERGIKYAVFYKEARRTGVPCVVEDQNRAQLLFEKYGQKVLENRSLSVYEFTL
jgi:hypothetical protein